jgi:GNAT superfamily N-acetyltransferase
MEIRPLTPKRFTDLEALFDTNGTTRGCFCMWVLVPSKEFSAGWGGGNRDAFAERVNGSSQPMGLLAYDRREPGGREPGAREPGGRERGGREPGGREPIGWCAAGPRAQYVRTGRSPLLRGRDPSEDADVWLVPCFFVRVGARRAGVTTKLLHAAVDLAASHGATAVEGYPRAATSPYDAASAFVGAESVFAECGFEVVRRPTPSRVVMRRDLV